MDEPEMRPLTSRNDKISGGDILQKKQRMLINIYFSLTQFSKNEAQKHLVTIKIALDRGIRSLSTLNMTIDVDSSIAVHNQCP